MNSGSAPGARRGPFPFLGAVVVAAALVLAACGDDDGLRPPPSTPGVAAGSVGTTPRGTGLTAVVDQFREDEILHLLQVRVTNDGDVAYHIASMQLDWPGLTRVAPTPRDTLVVPGQTIDVPIDYGRAVCAGDPPGAGESPPDVPAVAVAIVTPEGSSTPVQATIPVTDSLHIFERIFGPSCRDQRVEASVALHFGETWTPTTTADGHPALAGTLDVERTRTDQPVTIAAVGGSVLLDVHAAGDTEPPLVLAAGQSGAQIPVVIAQSGNCTGHALTESKKTFILPVQVVLGDEPAVPYEVTIATTSRPQFNDMINAACATS
jgi:hypothetical protein